MPQAVQKQDERTSDADGRRRGGYAAPAAHAGPTVIEVGLGLVVAAVVWAAWIEPRRLVLREVTVPVTAWPGTWPPLRIAVLADLHAARPHLSEARLAAIARRLAAQAPDLVLMPGDFVSTRTPLHRPLSPDEIARALSPLPAVAPCFAVLGNHDAEVGNRHVQAALEEVGIGVLRNEVVGLPWGDGRVEIAGLGCLRSGRADPARTFAGLTGDAPAILLSHVPDIFPAAPAAVVLTVAGHTHGGQVRIPGLGPIVTLSRLPRRMARGLHERDGRWLYVSAGVGTSALPVRFANPPEIAILTLRCSSASEAAARRGGHEVAGRARAAPALSGVVDRT